MTTHEANEKTIPGSGRRGLLRASVGASVGNVVEWFDYATYGYLAATIGVVFFPFENSTLSLLSSFATFGVAFFMRPLGGLLFGQLGDRIGRRGTLATAVLLMSTATFLIGFIPGYRTIGLWAPILLVAARLVQGFSAGGEFGGAGTFLAEHAPDRRRGFVVSWVVSSALAGFLLGLGIVLVLTSALSEAAMTSWGWRIPFLVAGPLGLIALYIRLRLEESPEFRNLEAAGEVAQAPVRESFTRTWKTMVQVIGLVVIHNASLYIILTYMLTYMTDQLKLSQTAASVSTLVALAVSVGTIPLFGALSDRVGRKPLMTSACVAFVLLSYPLLAAMGAGSYLVTVLAQAALGAVMAAYVGPGIAAYTELFPTRVRYTGFSVSYNVSVAIFGGGAPFFAVLLVSVTGNTLSPAFYVMGAAVLSLAALATTREKARESL
ncbi:MAG: MFS transporter [Streptosporangiales bacterium]|nr:MFS transporter [Streptosporangiales bacterium]